MVLCGTVEIERERARELRNPANRSQLDENYLPVHVKHGEFRSLCMTKEPIKSTGVVFDCIEANSD